MLSKLPIILRASLLAICAALLVAFLVQGAPNAFSIPWWTADGGGGILSGGDYSLSGTIGQPDAGSVSGGEFTLAGGFWSEAVSVPPPQRLFLPLVNR